MNTTCPGCTQMCINHTRDHYQQQTQDQSHFTVVIWHFFYKLKHCIALCAILRVCAYVCEQQIKSILIPNYAFWKGRLLWLWRLLQEATILQTTPCLWMPANTVPRLKKSLGACSVTTAEKKNQSSHFNCICLLVINLLVQKDRWGKWCINTNLAGLHWNY